MEQHMKHKGITPVVAMVLLLFMTVAAAGAAYAWTQGIIGGQQQDATQQLNTQLAVQDIQCDASNNELDYLLTNQGSTTVDASDVTVYKYSVSTGNLDGTASISDGDITPGSNWGSLAGGGQSTITAFSFTNGREYRIEFEFTNQGSYTVSDTCQAS
ncbi:MAG: archaellin/type IV pilin N-terminal domain-containing protein [Candidatus Nanohaloarchaea archaeon]